MMLERPSQIMPKNRIQKKRISAIQNIKAVMRRTFDEKITDV